MKSPSLFLRSLLLLSLVSSLQAASLSVENLRCDGSIDPLGIDTEKPGLSWQLRSPKNGKVQTAWQVCVATTQALLKQNKGDLWDSGRVRSAETASIPYGGTALRSSQQVFWKVRVWDEAGAVSAWSQPATWTMGIVAAGDWRAQWISDKRAEPALQSKPIGYHATEARRSNDIKWVQVDLGKSVPISAVTLVPMRHAGRNGFGFPARFKVEGANDAAFVNATVIADHTERDFANPGTNAVRFDTTNLSARYLRVTATVLWKRDTMYCFALRQLQATSGGTNAALGATVSHFDSVETWGWGASALTDGMAGTEPPSSSTLLLRRTFSVKPGLRRAVVHVSGLGQYELSANGRKVGSDLLSPGWTKYDRTCLYDTHDITSLLTPGENAVGLQLAGGMYRVVGGRYAKFTGSFGPLKTIGHLRLEYADGSVEVVTTDERWRVSPGPVTFSCIFGGEDYDARLEPHGWDKAGFDDSKWSGATICPGPGGKLRGHSVSAPPLREIEVLKPVSITDVRPGVKVYDFDQNASIVPRIRLNGSRGAVVRLIPAELLSPSGGVDRGSCGGGNAWWQYTCGDDQAADWFPRFWYHGSRYIEAHLIPGADGKLPAIEHLEAVVVHASSEPAGEFACSNELFNRIHTLVRWAQRANIVSVISDCPHRERLGWLEQYHLNGPSLRYEWNLDRLFTKGCNDMADSQLENGLVPDIAPEYVKFSGGFRDSPEWGSAIAVVPWQQYLFTGNADLLQRHYEDMKRYVAYLGSKSSNHIVNHGLGDWYDIGPKPPGVAQLTPVALTATAFYYYDAWIIAQAARLLGNKMDEENYTKLATNIAAAFNREFLKDPASYSTGSQCANALPLFLNLPPADLRSSLVDAIVRDVTKRGNAITAGDVGYRFLLRALADGGRSDVIYTMNNQSEHPGYGYQLKKGATSLTEAWDAGRASSQNHFMLGQINEWFYHDLAGIQPDPEKPGFKNIIIKPAIVGDLTFARARYQSVRGPISAEWNREGNRVTLSVDIPPNSTATVHVPGTDATLAGKGEAKQLSENTFSISSGRYTFVSTLPARETSTR